MMLSLKSMKFKSDKNLQLSEMSKLDILEKSVFNYTINFLSGYYGGKNRNMQFEKKLKYLF